MKHVIAMTLCFLLFTLFYTIRINADEIQNTETIIVLSNEGIQVTGGAADKVFISHDIIYYEDKDFYPSGFPYGAGTPEDRHSAEEADDHTVRPPAPIESLVPSLPGSFGLISGKNHTMTPVPLLI